MRRRRPSAAGCPGPPRKAVLACSAAVLARRAPRRISSPPIRRANAAPKPRVLARTSSCKARVPASLASTAGRRRYAPHLIGARALVHPCQPCGPLRCGTAATRAAPDPGHPPQPYALRAHAHLAHESPPHRALSSQPSLPRATRRRRRARCTHARGHRAPAWRSVQSRRTTTAFPWRLRKPVEK
jgi:hypothetical protein